MFQTTKALVLREVRYKEADRILTVLSECEGKLTVKARGALRKSSRTAAATQQLTYAELTLFGNRGKWTVNEGSVIEGFEGLRGDIEALALGSYFAECLEALSVEEQPDEAMLQLGLNALYALSRQMYDPAKIKAAFELRLMCLAGYAPDLTGCAACGKEPLHGPGRAGVLGAGGEDRPDQYAERIVRLRLDELYDRGGVRMELPLRRPVDCWYVLRCHADILPYCGRILWYNPN